MGLFPPGGGRFQACLGRPGEEQGDRAWATVPARSHTQRKALLLRWCCDRPGRPRVSRRWVLRPRVPQAWLPHPASRLHHLEVHGVAHWGALDLAEGVAGGQCSEQGPCGQAAGLGLQRQEGLPLQGHHAHHVQAVFGEGACLRGTGESPGTSCALRRPHHTPAWQSMGTRGARAGARRAPLPLGLCARGSCWAPPTTAASSRGLPPPGRARRSSLGCPHMGALPPHHLLMGLGERLAPGSRPHHRLVE